MTKGIIPTQHISLIIFLLIALFISGCQTSKRHEAHSSNFETPSQFEASPDLEVSEVEEYVSSPFPFAEMQDHLVLLFNKNIDIQGSIARVESALSRAEMARADLYPQVTGSLGGSKTRQNFIGLPIPGSSGPLTARFESYNLSFLTDWEIDIWGRVRNARDAAVLESVASELDHTWLKKSLVASYLQLWIHAQVALKSGEIDKAIIQNRESLVRVVEARFRSGIVNGDPVRNARNSLQSAQINSFQTQQDVRDAFRQLNKILGKYPDAQIELPGEMPALFPVVKPGLPSDIMAKRPDIQASKARLQAASKRVAESKAGLFPRISLTGSTGTSSDQLSDLTDLDFSVWSIGGNLARPILDYGTLRDLVDISKSNEKLALNQYFGAVQQALLEAENALDSEQVLRQSIALSEATLKRSQEQFSIAQERFSRGVGSHQSVMESEYLLLVEQQKLLNLKQRFFLNRIALDTALGGYDVPSIETAVTKQTNQNIALQSK